MTPSQSRNAGLLVDRKRRQDHFSIHLDWLRICQGSVARAAVLWAYNFREREDGTGELELTEADVRELLFNCWSLPTIRDARRWLIDRQFLTMRRGAHGTLCCRLNRDLIRTLVAEEQAQFPFEDGRSDEEKPAASEPATFSPPAPAQDTKNSPPAEVRTQNSPRPYIGSKNPEGKNNGVRTTVVETASTTEQETGGGDPLALELAYRTRDVEIPTDPDKAHALRWIASAIRKLPHLEQQKAVLEKLEDLVRKIRARRRTDIESWGYVVTCVRAWAAGFEKQAGNRAARTPEQAAPPVATPTPTPAPPAPPQPAAAAETGIWATVKQRLQVMLPAAAYANWIERTRQVGLADGRVTVEVPDTITKEWIEVEYAKQVQAALEGLPVARVALRVNEAAWEQEYARHRLVLSDPLHHPTEARRAAEQFFARYERRAG